MFIKRTLRSYKKPPNNQTQQPCPVFLTPREKEMPKFGQDLEKSKVAAVGQHRSVTPWLEEQRPFPVPWIETYRSSCPAAAAPG